MSRIEKKSRGETRTRTLRVHKKNARQYNNLIVAEHVWRRQRRRELPKGLLSEVVGNRQLRQGRQWRSGRLQHDVGRMHRVRMLFPLAQLAADNSNGHHGIVASDHFDAFLYAYRRISQTFTFINNLMYNITILFFSGILHYHSLTTTVNDARTQTRIID